MSHYFKHSFCFFDHCLFPLTHLVQVHSVMTLFAHTRYQQCCLLREDESIKMSPKPVWAHTRLNSNQLDLPVSATKMISLAQTAAVLPGWAADFATTIGNFPEPLTSMSSPIGRRIDSDQNLLRRLLGSCQPKHTCSDLIVQLPCFWWQAQQ